MSESDTTEKCFICSGIATKQEVWTGIWFCDQPECWEDYKEMRKRNDPQLIEELARNGR